MIEEEEEIDEHVLEEIDEEEWPLIEVDEEQTLTPNRLLQDTDEEGENTGQCSCSESIKQENVRLRRRSVRFGICLSVASKLFQKWLDIMFVRLPFLITWPECEVCKHNMPNCFKELYSNCRCIIDCSEIFIEQPKNYAARQTTYSNYKKNNTIKFLIGITPFGTISFLSPCWGGKVSDKNLTQSSNFFNCVERGDTILADRGFTIAEDLAVYGADLKIPAFTRGKKSTESERSRDFQTTFTCTDSCRAYYRIVEK